MIYLKMLIVSVILGVQISAASTSWQSIEKTIEENPDLKTVDEFVPLLPDSLKRNFALVYKSRGLAKKITSFDTPRTILYGRGDIFLSYTGCENDPSRDEIYPQCESIEILHEDEYGKLTAKVIYFSGVTSQGKPQIKAPVSKCTSCHGTEIRPLFEPHDTWVGTYGSLSNDSSDVISSDTNEYRGYLKFIDKILKVEGDRIQARKNGAGIDRYSALSWKLGESVVPEKTEVIPVLHGISKRPNAELNTEMNRMNLRRIFRLLRAQGEPFKYAIQWWGKCMMELDPVYSYLYGRWLFDPRIDDLFPKKYSSSLQDYKSFRDEMGKMMISQYHQHLDEVLKDNRIAKGVAIIYEAPLYFYNAYVPALIRLMDLMGMPSQDLSTSFEMQPFSHSTIERGVAELRPMINAFYAESDPELAGMDCKTLKAKSVEVLE